MAYAIHTPAIGSHVVSEPLWGCLDKLRCRNMRIAASRWQDQRVLHHDAGMPGGPGFGITGNPKVNTHTMLNGDLQV